MIGRAAASVVVAASLVLGTSGCAFFAPQATLIHYEPADGVAVNVGDMQLRNVVALSSDGETASLSFTIVNNTGELRSIDFSADAADGTQQTQTIVVSPGSTTVGGGGDDPTVVFTGLGTTVGALLPVFVIYGTEVGKGMQVPILDGTQEQFATLVPTTAP